MRRASCLVLSLLLGLVLCSMASAGTAGTVAVGEITGNVLMPDGSPAAGAHVRAIGFRVPEEFPLTYEQLWTLETTTAEDGTFRLPPDPAAKDKLFAQIRVTVSILATHESAGATGTTVYRTAAEVGEALAAGGLRLNEPATLTGTVTDAGGRPLAQATVVLLGWMTEKGAVNFQVFTEMSPLRVGTQSDGTFAFERVPKGGRFTLVVQKEGHPDVLVTSASDPVSIVLPKPGSLTGRVVSVEGEPLADCQVWLLPPVGPQEGRPGPWQMRTPVVTDQDGHFAVPTLFPTTYDLRVEPPASTRDRWAPGVVRNQAVLAGQTTDVGKVVLTPGGTLVGRAFDVETAKPIPEVRVSAVMLGARSVAAYWSVGTDAEGRYQFHLPPGTYEVRASVSGYTESRAEPRQPREVSVQDSSRSECDLELHPVFAVKGTLLLPDGSPAANCTIRSRRPSGFPDAQTDAGGRFTLQRVSAGEQVHISADDPEHAARLSTSFTVPADKSELTFTMEKAAACLVTGRVVDDDGKPMPGMQVSIYESAGSTSYLAAAGSTDAEGRFSVRVLQGGEGLIDLGDRWRIISRERQLRFDSERVDKGDVVAPSLDQVVAGIVVDIDGEPVPGADIQAGGVSKWVSVHARTGSGGRFRLEKLPKDTIQIEAFLVDPETGMGRNKVREQVPPGSMDVRLVLPLKQKAETGPTLRAGDRAPELVLEEGAGVTLAQFKGKPVMLAFVSIYSRPCVKVLDDLKALQEKQGADKLAVVAVHDRTATPEEIAQFRKDHGIPFPIVRVPDAPRDGWDSATFRAYGVTALPTVVRIDAEGKVESVGTSLP